MRSAPDCWPILLTQRNMKRHSAGSSPTGRRASAPDFWEGSVWDFPGRAEHSPRLRQPDGKPFHAAIVTQGFWKGFLPPSPDCLRNFCSSERPARLREYPQRLWTGGSCARSSTVRQYNQSIRRSLSLPVEGWRKHICLLSPNLRIMPFQTAFPWGTG